MNHRDTEDTEKPTPFMHEDGISQIPALQLLRNLGYTYLTPEEALALRGGRAAEVLLLGVLEKQLPKINRIRFKGEEFSFSGGNIAAAIEALRDVLFDGLVRTNEKIYDLLCLGKSLQQPVLGDLKSFTLQYIDWANPARNVFHVTEEYEVERTGSKETRRPDLVLFVNGIPLCIIECKSPNLKDPIKQAISQHIRNQKDDEIPKLFLYGQLLVAVSKNEAKYGTVGTPAKFWAVWKEDGDCTKRSEERAETGLSPSSDLHTLINRPVSGSGLDKVLESRPGYVREAFARYGEREATPQDHALYALCRPERLLELSQRFILFDAGEKKVARYQQYFTVNGLLQRIKERDGEGRRKGGVVWHTQGSGKSLTMVMFAKSLALETGLHDHRIILVTDRIDLDDQIKRTFEHCGLEPVKARTGNHLVEMLKAKKERVITSLINKFEASASVKGARFNDPNLFVLVDEGHRGQYGPMHAKMRKVLPMSCYIGFTGTPVMRKDKNTVEKFGGLIQPTYTITQAVEDKAVVPLLYEGRFVPQEVDQEAIDRWFEKITANLSKGQTADLKKKFATSDHLQRAEQRIMAIAWDISMHWRDNWKGTGFKAQLVVPWKHIALLYKKHLDEFGMVTSEVLISGPDDREGEEDIYEENREPVVRFWKGMLDKYGSEEEYNRSLIGAFKNADDPEIIIVCHKLLTGFDAPRNTVMYLDRDLKEHTLLQAIARVNRLHEGKDFGYIIDYRGVLTNLGRALATYSEMLPDFDAADLEGTLTDIGEVVARLPQQHSDLWDIFKEIANKYDEEAYEQLLADDALRSRFYDRLRDFSKTLTIALASVDFIEKTPEQRVNKYKRDLKFFTALRTAVSRRYAETVDFSEYEPKIAKLIDRHVGAGEVERLTELVNIFEKDKFEAEIERVTGEAAKADTIAHRTKRTILERMDEDPAFYKKFSQMLKEIIEAFRQRRIEAAEYLRKARQVMENVINRTGDELPAKLAQADVPKAFYGIIRLVLERDGGKTADIADAGADVALAIDEIIRDMRIVSWAANADVQNRMRTRIEDYLFELKDQRGIQMSFEDIDAIMEDCLKVARLRYA